MDKRIDRRPGTLGRHFAGPGPVRTRLANRIAPAGVVGVLAASLLALSAGTSAAATFTVSKDGRGAFATIQAAVDKAGKGDVVEILDAAVYPEQVTIDSTRHGLTLRSANPDALQKPTIRWQDVQNQSPRTCQEALTTGKTNFDQNGALRLIRVRNVTVDGVGIDASAPAPFSWPGVWGNGTDCTGQTFPLFHGNGGIALYLAGGITVRRCDIRNAFFGIAVKDRNEGGVFANFNPADLEKHNIVPLSGFGRTGGHVFERNRIHHNVWGFYFESIWDLASTVRYNLVYENHHATPAAAAAVKAMADGEHHPGGGLLFKDAMLSPLAVYNNTFWRNFTLFSGGYRPGAQHLVFNNIFARPHEYWSGNVYQNPFHALDPYLTHRMEHSLYAAQTEAPRADSQKVQAQRPDPATNQQVVKDSVVRFHRAVRIMNGMGNVVQDALEVELVLPLSAGPVTVRETVTGVNLPGGLIQGSTVQANSLVAFPAAANVRWLEIGFKSTDPAGPDFLSPDWDDPLIRKLVQNAGWPDAGIHNADGQVADIGAVPSSPRHADDVLIKPLSPVILNGTSATLSFDLAPVAGGLTSPKVKVLRFVRSLPVALTGFGGSSALVVPPAVDLAAPGTPLKMGANTLTVTGLPALGPTESYAFFELVVEGIGSNGKPATTNVGFLPWRKLDYKFLVEVLDASGVKKTSVKVGEAVRLRIIPQRLDGTPFTNAVTPVEVNLNSGNDLVVPGPPPARLVLAKVEGQSLSDVMFTRVPAGGTEYVTVSGIWKNGINTLAFYGVSDGVRILPGDPEKVVFQDPPSKILSPGSAPVIDPGQSYPVTVEVQDRFGNAVGAGAAVTLKSNHPAIGDVEGPASAATDSAGVASFRARVTQGDLGEIFELEAALAGKTPDKADLKVGQPRDRLWILYSDVAGYDPAVELRGTAGVRLPVTLRAGKTADVKLADRATAVRVEATAGLAVYASTTAPAPASEFTLAAGEVVVYVTGLRAVENGALTVSPVADNTLLPGTRGKIYFSFSPDAVQAASVHADNGFGRVDRLELLFRSDLKRTPDSVALSWPAPGAGTQVIRAGLAWDPASPRRVTVTLTSPFPEGVTTFAGSAELGMAWLTNPAAPELPVQALPFSVSDSVGPLLDSARVQERLEPSDDTLFVSLSEKAAGLVGASLVLLRREGGAPVTLAVLTASDLAQGRRFKVAVADLGTQAPREGDSLRINPTGPLVDAFGNRAHAQNRPVVLGLRAVPRPPLLTIRLDRPVASGLVPAAARPADFLILSPAADSSLLPVLGGGRGGQARPCDPGLCGAPLAAGTAFPGPTFTLETDRPFQFTVTIFTNLGGFVNSFAGEITAAHLGLDAKGLPVDGADAAFRRDARGRHVLRLAWSARAHDGALAGTGAYLAKVVMSGRGEDADGKTFGVTQGRTLRLGILR